MYAQVIIDIASSNVDKLYTYRVPSALSLQVGHRVSVPFGPRAKEGYVIALKEEANYDESKIREVICQLDSYPAVLPSLIALAHEIKEDTNCSMCEALRFMIPAQMRKGRVQVKEEQVAQLCMSSEALKAYLETLSKRKVKQRMLLTVLGDGKVHTLKSLKSLINNPLDTLKELHQLGHVTLSKREVLRTPMHTPTAQNPDPNLMPLQQEVLEELVHAVKLAKPALFSQRRNDRTTARQFAFLLHGVTGSGKTEVYIRLVRACLELGKTAIVLVPEIALTPQMTDWFHARFGALSAVLHSRLSPGERYDEWRRIRRGEAKVVIGARSAIFAPLENIGAIIIDEEHEQTYQAEHFPPYDAREIAQKRATREGAIVLLASATPSIQSYAQAKRGDYTLLEMPTRVMQRPLPSIHIVDMREELRLNNRGIFSTLLLEKLTQCLEKNEQAIIFINRRGFSPSVSCRACGHVMKCAHCDVAMTYHKPIKMLKCHYCNVEVPLPLKCPSCEAKALKPMGIGTQKVQEELEKLFPKANIIRMDYDTTQKKDAHATLIQQFREHKAQILVGTQMIAKGLDFPSVTLVGAVMADLSLNMPDYRASEKTFQLLLQVAGRAGRATKEGEVVIQTYKPEHFALQTVQGQTYIDFYEQEFARRKASLYPPFTTLARFLCEASTKERAYEMAEELFKQSKKWMEEHPTLRKRMLFIHVDFAPIAFIQGRSRAHVLMKLLNHQDTKTIFRAFHDMAKAMDCNKEELISFEINPTSLA